MAATTLSILHLFYYNEDGQDYTLANLAKIGDRVNWVTVTEPTLVTDPADLQLLLNGDYPGYEPGRRVPPAEVVEVNNYDPASCPTCSGVGMVNGGGTGNTMIIGCPDAWHTIK